MESQPTPTQTADIREDDSMTAAEIAANASDNCSTVKLASDTGAWYGIDKDGTVTQLNSQGTTTLAGLTDTTISSPADLDKFIYDDDVGGWVNVPNGYVKNATTNTWEAPVSGQEYVLDERSKAILHGMGFLRRYDDNTWEEVQNSSSGNVHIYWPDKPDNLIPAANQTLLMIKLAAYTTTAVDNAVLTIGSAGTVNPHSQDGLVVNSNTRAPLGGNTPGLTTCEAGLYIPDQTTRVLNVRRGSVNVSIQWASFYFFVDSTFAV